jgi:hypothetical protein
MALSDLQRALVYGESELGNKAVIKETDGTFTVTSARSGAVVNAAGTAAATVKAAVAVIHPSVLKITS